MTTASSDILEGRPLAPRALVSAETEGWRNSTLDLLTFLAVAILLLGMNAPANAQQPEPPSLVMLDGQAYHDFTQLPLTPSGWTDFEAMVSSPGYSDSRVVFVSSSNGSDAAGQVYGVEDVEFDEHGVFQPKGVISPYRTLAAAYAQIRGGFADILLLSRGDEWAEGFTRTGAGRIKSGRSVQERHIITSYGSGERPRLVSAMIDARDASYSVVAGLKLYENDWRTSGRALDITGAVNHQLYEDMRFHQKNEDKLQGGSDGITNVAFRRNFYSHYQAHDGFMYVARADRVLFEENVYFEPWQKGHPDETRHGRHLYLSPSGAGDDKNALTNLELRGNIFFRAERGGIDGRAGGVIYNNLSLQSSNSFGGHGGSQGSIQSVQFVHNVMMQGTPNDGTSNDLILRNIDGGVVSNNIWTDPRGISSRTSTNVILVGGSGDVSIARNIDISQNVIYGFRVPGGAADSRGLDLSNSFTDVQNFRVVGNDFQFVTGSAEIVRHRNWAGSGGDRFEGYEYSGNRYYTSSDASPFAFDLSYNEWVAESGEVGSSFARVDYPDPERTIDSYMVSLGQSGGAEEFMALALNQSRGNWEAAYTAAAVNDYIRKGFGIVPRGDSLPEL
ncbi:MAG: hypothetical protein JJT88_12420 [Gammaproteobacteria bacterium]|nr:hypothetical protein [Gammaproteobacteria bacterium]